MSFTFSRDGAGRFLAVRSVHRPRIPDLIGPPTPKKLGEVVITGNPDDKDAMAPVSVLRTRSCSSNAALRWRNAQWRAGVSSTFFGPNARAA